MFHSYLNIPFLNDPMFWRTLLTTTVLPLMLLEDESEDKKRPSNAPFFSVRVSEIRSFTRVENGVLISLGNKGTGVSQEMKRSCQAQAH